MSEAAGVQQAAGSGPGCGPTLRGPHGSQPPLLRQRDTSERAVHSQGPGSKSDPAPPRCQAMHTLGRPEHRHFHLQDGPDCCSLPTIWEARKTAQRPCHHTQQTKDAPSCSLRDKKMSGFSYFKPLTAPQSCSPLCKDCSLCQTHPSRSKLLFIPKDPAQ